MQAHVLPRYAALLALVGATFSTASVAGECYFDQHDLVKECTNELRMELAATYCSDLGEKGPIVGKECAGRYTKAGVSAYCDTYRDLDLYLPKAVSKRCKMGDTLILKDPTLPRFPGKLNLNWVGSPFDQTVLTRFCARTSIKRLDVGDYACVIDRGLPASN